MHHKKIFLALYGILVIWMPKKKKKERENDDCDLCIILITLLLKYFVSFQFFFC